MAAERFALALLLVVPSGCTDDATTPAPTPDPYVTTVESDDPLRIRLPTDESKLVEIPPGWSYVTTPGTGHLVAMTVTTRPELLYDIREDDAHGGLASYSGIPEAELERSDAFVELYATYVPATGRSTPFTNDLRLPDFSVEERILGRPVLIYGGEGEDGGIHSVRYWSGPDASPDTVEAALELALSIDA